jgi:hypothetical protein
MNISDVTNATQTQPVAQSPPVNPKPAQSTPQPTTTDSVTLSSSAKAVLAEANETASQTAQEASRGDMQAQRRLERIAEAKGTMKKSISELV